MEMKLLSCNERTKFGASKEGIGRVQRQANILLFIFYLGELLQTLTWQKDT